jgi:putative ABC transport system permease protein
MRASTSKPFMSGLSGDLRFAVRNFRVNPGFFVTAVAVLALGIGAATAMFSVVNTVMLRPLPYPGAAQIVWVGTRLPVIPEELMTGPDYLELRERVKSFESYAGYSGGMSCDISGRGEPQRVQCASVTREIFSVLGMQPFLGRAFSPDEDRPGGPPVVIVTYGFWQRVFDGDPHVIGQAITVEGRRQTVVGVMPREYRSPYNDSAEIIRPIGLNVAEELQRRRMMLLFSIARLRPGVTLAQAQGEVTGVMDSIKQRYGRFYRPETRVNLTPLREYQVRNVRLALLVLLGAVAAVLLIACANVANLLLARASGRRAELAVRAALGAGRRRVARQLLTESALLGLVGGLLGVAIVAASTGLLRRLLPADLPHAQDLGVDARVLVFAFAVSFVTGLIFGVAPAFTTARLDIYETLKQGGARISSRGGLRSALVVAEIGVSTAVVVAAALLIQSLWRLETVKTGFRRDHLLTTDLNLPRTPGPIAEPDWAFQGAQQQAQFLDTAMTRIAAIPGVVNVAVASAIPPEDSRALMFMVVHLEGEPPPDFREERNRARVRAVSPEFFAALGIPLRAGRLFEPRDASAQPVAVVNEAFVRQFSSAQNAVGRKVAISDNGKRTAEIIGVVADSKNAGLTKPAEPEIYRPLLQHSFLARSTLIVRTAQRPDAAINDVRAVIRGMDANLPLTFQTMDDYLAEVNARPRFQTGLLSSFAAIALILAGIGIFGVVSYTVTQRTQEIGIRMSLGAEPAGIRNMIVGQVFAVTILGIATGLGLAAIFTRYLATMLYGVSVRDAATFALSAVVLAGVAMLASYIPARRAARVDPAIALRYE